MLVIEVIIKFFNFYSTFISYKSSSKANCIYCKQSGKSLTHLVQNLILVLICRSRIEKQEISISNNTIFITGLFYMS